MKQLIALWLGRVYYAVYLATRDWIDQRFSAEIKEVEGNSHEKYTNCLLVLQRKNMDLTLSRFSRELKVLKKNVILPIISLTF